MQGIPGGVVDGNLGPHGLPGEPPARTRRTRIRHSVDFVAVDDRRRAAATNFGDGGRRLGLVERDIEILAQAEQDGDGEGDPHQQGEESTENWEAFAQGQVRKSFASRQDGLFHEDGRLAQKPSGAEAPNGVGLVGLGNGGSVPRFAGAVPPVNDNGENDDAPKDGDGGQRAFWAEETGMGRVLGGIKNFDDISLEKYGRDHPVLSEISMRPPR